MNWENLKSFLVGLVSRWILKLAGGFLIGIGYDAGSSETLIAGVVAFVIGLIISVIQNKFLAKADPEAVAK